MVRPSLLKLRMADVTFVHWPVDPALVRGQLPDGLAVDTFDGDAYLSVVGLRMSTVRPPGVPVGRTFGQVNVRTYVTGADGPGVYFFSMDADAPLGVALGRRLAVPYHRADVEVGWDGAEFRLRSQRRAEGGAVRFDASFRPHGEVSPPEPDSLAASLAERRLFYADGGDGRTYVGRIAHPPWPLQDADATIRTNDLLPANGFDVPDARPTVQYSPGVATTVESYRPVSLPLVGGEPDRERPRAANRK